MPPFRRVEAEQAGHTAVGILVPPGPRTVLIVRPRGLDWDLLLLAPARDADPGKPFREVGREEVPGLTRELHQALEAWAAGGPGAVLPVAVPAKTGFQVRVEVGALALTPCLRVPGRPYRPLTFVDADEAREAAARLRAVLCPPADAGQELYFNTRHFAR
jgi:hypothetical protein